MIRRPPRSTLFPTRRSSDLRTKGSAHTSFDIRPPRTCFARAWISIQFVAGSDTFRDRKSTRLNSSHLGISYAVFCLKKKKIKIKYIKSKKETQYKLLP